jgi:nitrogen fixation NifU-like protein
MGSLSELYQNVILDHNRAPRNYRKIEDADRHAEGYNPLCGDQLSVWIKMEGDRIADVSFLGSGCAISKASASLMTSIVKGKTRGEAVALFDQFQRMITGQETSGAVALPAKLEVFSGVKEFPARVKCAGLSWHALKAALESREEAQVSTEY